MLFKSATFAAIVSAVLADQTFTLTATGNGISGPVTKGSDGFVFSIGNGATADFTLTEPDGYLSVDGKYLVASSDGISEVASAGDASHPWGIVDNQLRLNLFTTWFACKADTGYKINSYDEGGCTSVELTVGGAAPAESTTSSEKPSSTKPVESSTKPVETSSTKPVESSTAPATTSSKAESASTETSVVSSHTLVTVTSCGPEVTDCPAKSSISTYQGGAAKGAAGAGALMVAAAALLA